MLPPHFHGWTMKRRLLWLLRESNRTGDGYVYLDQLIEHVGYTFRNRVSELRADGHNIKAENDRIAGWRYRLDENPQMSLFEQQQIATGR